jgi:tRNA(Leu) C34 or U34 (ribose-2'-O)-methylase TrmL
VITLRKLAGLPAGTRGRKLLTLLAEDHGGDYQKGLVRMAEELLGEEQGRPGSVPGDDRTRAVLRYRLARHLRIEVADWDLQAPPDRTGEVRRFPFSAYLDDLRSPFNVGSILRTAEAYGFEAVFPSPMTPGTDHPRTRRTAMGAEAYLRIESVSLEVLRERSGDRPAFALELGGTPVDEFSFPAEGVVLLGGEELGLSPEALAWADGSAGRVSLPLYGRKASLNVGVAFGILAEAWTRSRRRPSTREGGTDLLDAGQQA